MRRWLLYVAIGLVIVGAVVFALTLILPSWFWHPLGYCVGSKVAVRDCYGYNSWSGSFSDIGEVTLIGGMVTVVYQTWRHVNCADPKCRRIGKYKTADGLHRYCGPHHPDKPHLHTTAEIHARHRRDSQ